MRQRWHHLAQQLYKSSRNVQWVLDVALNRMQVQVEQWNAKDRIGVRENSSGTFRNASWITLYTGSSAHGIEIVFDIDQEKGKDDFPAETWPLDYAETHVQGYPQDHGHVSDTLDDRHQSSNDSQEHLSTYLFTSTTIIVVFLCWLDSRPVFEEATKVARTGKVHCHFEHHLFPLLAPNV
ncbi:hypothetical protein HZH68_005049 [Vespula germanica]|uniref:Uncharacterized protein n=1 Tax=Vespula germanica TaxID=30212 RepID=A0A834NE72_VESGE|nr:hypothetical protein HZH68_005049 [Vespula germanica]